MLNGEILLGNVSQVEAVAEEDSAIIIVDIKDEEQKCIINIEEGEAIVEVEEEEALQVEKN